MEPERMSTSLQMDAEADSQRVRRAVGYYAAAVFALGIFSFGGFDVTKQLLLRAYGNETVATVTGVRSMWIKNSRTWSADYQFVAASGKKVHAALDIPTPPPQASASIERQPGEYRETWKGGRVTVIYAERWPRFHIVKADRYVWSYALSIYLAALAIGLGCIVLGRRARRS